MIVGLDIETDSLDPTIVWVVVAKDLEDGKVHVFLRPDENPEPFLSFMAEVSVIVGHNVIDFDLPSLRKLVPNFRFDPNSIIDTLVCTRLLNFDLEDGNSLEAWGERLGVPKTYFKDFSNFSQEMVDYCIQDVEVLHKLYDWLLPYLQSDRWKESLRLEHDMAWICRDLHDTGFYFDKQKADELYAEIVQKLQELDKELATAFPPRSKLLREITPKATKAGTLNKAQFRFLELSSGVFSGDEQLSTVPKPYHFQPGAPFSLIEWVDFNAGSPKQVVERLNEAGWKPFEKTKGHIKAERERDKEKLEHYRVWGWSVSEANLATLPPHAPEAARKLVQRLLLDSRRSTLEEWARAFSEATNRIHGRFNHIGAWTGRMSHAAPNMANVPGSEAEEVNDPVVRELKVHYGHVMRELWTVPERRVLVGTDADSIQLRILAHYMNDSGFTEALVNGNKEYGTDAHTMNMKALGPVCRSRAIAKRFIYAWLLGAGIGKVSEILTCSHEEAREAVDNFIASYPGLKLLKEEQIPYDAQRGFFDGLDGRAVMCDSAHHMLAGYLQNGESVIMKRANRRWRNELDTNGIFYKQVNFVHDEWQTETLPEYAEYVAKVQRDAIKIEGEILKLNCPLLGTSDIGYNWKETH